MHDATPRPAKRPIRDPDPRGGRKKEKSMNRLFRVLPLALFVLSAFAARAEDEKEEGGGDTKAGDEVKEAVIKAMTSMLEKDYTFTGQLDLEANESPMLNTEMKGTKKGKYTKISMDMMGQEMETYTNGKAAVAKDPQTGEWKLQEGQNLGQTTDPKQMEKVIKSAEWDDEEVKVGSRQCRVAKAKVNKDEVKKLLGQGAGMGQNADLKKSSLRFYIDKEDHQLYRMKLSMTLSMDMGGGDMEMVVTMDTKYGYDKKVELKIPKEVEELFDGGGDEDEKKEPKKDGGKDEDEEEDEE
jgi:hypothetical protein